VHSLNAEVFVNGSRKKKEEKETKLRKSRRQERIIRHTRINQVNNTRSKKPDMKTWNQKECKAYIKLKKDKKTDRMAMPKAIANLQNRCLELVQWPTPTCSPHLSDNECSYGILSDYGENEEEETMLEEIERMIYAEVDRSNESEGNNNNTCEI
jgi:hypothetical protein